MFWWIIFGGITGCFLGVVTCLLIVFQSIIKHFERFWVFYIDKWITILRKTTWKNFFESNMRAQTGMALDRPYGLKGPVFKWDNLIFNPVYLTKQPLDNKVKINTEVVLGPKALKPLVLKIPIIIAGMAYGSGYSAPAKIALAKGSALAGTATNSGNGAFLEDERKNAEKFILQYTRGFWSKHEAILKQADMIEIALGHSARGSSPVRIKGSKITPDVAKGYGTIPGLDVLMEARLPEVESLHDWKVLIHQIKEITGGVPVSVKFGASHTIEKELEIFVQGGVDVVAFDGLEGGTHGGASILMDDMGLPVFPALCRAVTYLEKNGLKNRISLIIGGALFGPGDFAKCLALGADAVLVGTITALVQSHTQVLKAIPWEPPTGLLYNDGKEKDMYNPDLGAKHIYHYLHSCVKEMEELARTLGKSSLKDLERQDLVALDPIFAEIAGLNDIGYKYK